MRAWLQALTIVACACAGAPGPAKPAAKPARADTRPIPARVERRVVVSLSRPSGSSILRIEPGGVLHTLLHVVENGRGPHVEARLQLAADGTLSALDASGQHELGTQFTARFRREGDRTSWQSSEESGTRQVEGPAFFVPLAELPEIDGLSVRAALQNGGVLPLLPAGELRVEKVLELPVQANGASRTLVGYRLRGRGLVPSYTWMNGDGSWFGSVSPWFSVVPEGWESAIAQLVDEQLELARADDARAFRELAHRPVEAGLAFTHARVLDVERGRWLLDHTVLVVKDSIALVAPSRRVQLPAAVEIIDAAGRALIPGLWDMHAHLGEADGALNIASGVTSVRDVGNEPDTLDDYKRRFDAGEAIGPHVLRFGFIEGRGEKAASSTVTAGTEEEASAAVKFFADRGYEGIKIYNSVKPELVPIIAREAHAHGMRVTGHVPVHMLASDAIRAGYDGIEHINMLFLNFLATRETETRDITRFTLVGDKGADLDLRSQPVREFFALLERHKTIVDPTVSVFEGLLLAEQGAIAPGLEAMAARLPVAAARSFLLGGLPRSDHKPRYQASFAKILAMLKALYDEKITLVTGTDDLAGLMLHHELELYARAGIPNAAIMRMATIEAARCSGLAHVSGSIAKGKRADLVLIDGDPLARIADVGRVVSTARAGVLFDAAAVYQTVSVQPYGGR